MADFSSVDLVGDSRPVVTPQATEQLANAFRRGYIGVQDIMERVSERTRTKQELELVTAQQGIAEATNPELIQAKQNQQLLAGEQAQQTRDLLPLARRASEEKLFGDIRSGELARYGIKEKLSALNDVGFAPAPDAKGITPEYALEVNHRFGKLIKLQKRKSDAVFGLATVDAGDVVVAGATYRGPMDKLTGKPGDDRQVAQWRKDAAMTLPEFLLEETPGEVVAPAPLIQPTQQPVTQAAPLIQPAQPVGVPPGFTQVKPAPVVAENLKRTDALQRELVQLQSVDASINQARQLAVPGIVGPGQIGVTRGMHQLLAALGSDKAAQTYTDQDQLNTVIANEIAEYVRDWKGAISDKELRFFQSARPRVDSTPERWTTYLDEWQIKNEKLKKIVAGELAPDEPAVWAANPKSGAGVPVPTAPVATTPSAAPVFTLTEASKQPSGTVFKDANGNWRRKL